MSRVLPLLLAIVLSCLAAEAQQKPCSHAESLQVEDEAKKLRTWEVLYKSYGLYARCNNVDAEDGYSESVARILVDYWQTLPGLSHLGEKDRRFWDFVLGHVDATLNMDDVGKIRSSAIQRCQWSANACWRQPTHHLSVLCKDLEKATNAATAALGHSPSVDRSPFQYVGKRVLASIRYYRVACS
jgi:hypothetical protein